MDNACVFLLPLNAGAFPTLKTLGWSNLQFRAGNPGVLVKMPLNATEGDDDGFGCNSMFTKTGRLGQELLSKCYEVTPLTRQGQSLPQRPHPT